MKVIIKANLSSLYRYKYIQIQFIKSELILSMFLKLVKFVKDCYE